MTDQVQVERRAGQRFEYHLPVTIRLIENSAEFAGCTENLSTRGAFLYADRPIVEGAAVELTLTMPSEITLGEKMRVRCKGRVLRAIRSQGGTKSGIAVHFESYEYLPAQEDVGATFERLSALHAHAAS